MYLQLFGLVIVPLVVQVNSFTVANTASSISPNLSLGHKGDDTEK